LVATGPLSQYSLEVFVFEILLRRESQQPEKLEVTSNKKMNLKASIHTCAIDMMIWSSVMLSQRERDMAAALYYGAVLY
jgi:hypothetical protein